MDINDFVEPRMDFNIIVQEPTADMEYDKNKLIPAVRRAHPTLMTNLVVHELRAEEILP